METTKTVRPSRSAHTLHLVGPCLVQLFSLSRPPRSGTIMGSWFQALLLMMIVLTLPSASSLPNTTASGKWDSWNDRFMSSSSSLSSMETNSVNASIIDGYLHIKTIQPMYIGYNSSAIQGVIDRYFPRPNYKDMASGLKYNVWLNSTSNTLSYLVIKGNYLADVPIFLPDQFILVFDNARLEASVNFTTATNAMAIEKSAMALIVSKNSFFNAVVSPSGPSNAVISCVNMPKQPIETSIVGPAGILILGSGSSLIDGVTIDSCGLGSGNIALYGSSRVEISNVISINGRTRGIWIIVTSYTLLHGSTFSGSGKFGIDMDAGSGPLTIIFDCDVHDSGYQGIFFEQGSQDAIVTNNILERNYNGVSFFNNDFPKTCSGHVVSANFISSSFSAGVNFGSLNGPTAGFHPTSDVYMIGNSLNDNTIGRNASYGFSSNGPAFGVVLIANNDGQGLSVFMLKKLVGDLTIVDPLKRMQAPEKTHTNTRHPTAFPSLSPVATPASISSRLTALNVTIKDGIITELLGIASPELKIGMYVGKRSSALNVFIYTHFRHLATLGDISLYPWIWESTAPRLLSFLMLKGRYESDEALNLPSHMILVFEDALLVASARLMHTTPALIIAENSYYSGVVSPSGVGDGAVIDCDGKSLSAILVQNSSYFTIDGITMIQCGGREDGKSNQDAGAITVIGGNKQNPRVGNSTSLLNSRIENAGGIGLLLIDTTRAIIYNSDINYASGSGIVIRGESYGAVISDTQVTSNGGAGILISEGSCNTILTGNLISGNDHEGISIVNSVGYRDIVNCAIIRNQIVYNRLSSIVLHVDNTSVISSTMICGNKMSYNGGGLSVIDPSRWSDTGIEKIFYGSNDDVDGITTSFCSQTNGNSVAGGSGNFFLDPMDRGRWSALESNLINWEETEEAKIEMEIEREFPTLLTVGFAMLCLCIIYCDTCIIGFVLRTVHECGGHGHQSVIFPGLRSYERVRDQPRELELVDSTSTMVPKDEAIDATLDSSASTSLPISLSASTEGLNTNSSKIKIESKTSEEVLEGGQCQEESTVIVSV